MNTKINQCVVTAPVNGEEKRLFVLKARDLNVSCNVLMRRLVRYFLDGKILWDELFKLSKKLPGVDEAGSTGKTYIRTRLELDQYAAFTQVTEDWGSTASVVLRRLVLLYITGDIERRDIW
jgi:hypothetical protein